MLIEPKIRFSKWVRWSDRGALGKSSPCMGVYVWAHFRTAPPRDSRPFPDLPEELIYVGEGNDLNIRPLTGRHHRLKHYVDQFPQRSLVLQLAQQVAVVDAELALRCCPAQQQL